MKETILEAITSIISEAPVDQDDLNAIKLVMKKFDMVEDYDEVKRDVSAKSGSSLSKLVLALCVELEANQDLLKKLARSYSGE